LNESGVGAAVARSFGLLAAGRGLVILLQFTTLALLADGLGPAGLGVYTFAIAIATLFRAIPDFGLSLVATRDVAQAPEREAWLVPNLAFLRVTLGVVAYALLALTVFMFDFGSENRSGALIAGLVLLVALDIFRASLEVRLRLAYVAIADGVEAVGTLAFVGLVVTRDLGVESVLWAYVALKLVNALIVTRAARRLTSFSWRPRPDKWRPLLATAIPLGIAGILTTVYYRLDIVILAAFKPESDVGQYGVAFRFLEAITVVPALLMAVLSPVLSRSFVEGEGVLQRRYAQSVHLVSVIAIALAVGGAMTAWRFLDELPGFGDYAGAGIALAILAPAAALIFVGTIVQSVLVSGHLQRRLLVIAGSGVGVNAALTIGLVIPFSYVGAAVATLATEVFLLVFSLIEVRRRLRLRWPLARFARALVAGAALAAVLAVGYLLDPLLQLAVGLVAAGPLAFAAGAIRRDDLRVLRRARSTAA
jgi:O-antigen/teichoic acid export membrane protein